jgi:uncharacterized membrane protein
MNPMTHLIVAALAFLATHYVSSTPLRGKLVTALGNKGYLALYSALAFATLGWMILAYYRAPSITLWYAPGWRFVPLFVMPIALILIVCGLAMRNPTAVGQERALKSVDAARGILRITRHPLMWGIALWAASHALARADAASLVFFGSFLVLALTGTRLMDRRKHAALGADWERFASVTSNLPFGAIAGGRNQFRAGEIGWIRILAGIGLYFIVLAAHPFLFGARPY